jgi:hypothetical protein
MSMGDNIVKMRTSFLILFGLILLFSGCQHYYCKVFRLENVQLESESKFPETLLDEPLGKFQESDLFVRVVATWDSNNKNRLHRDTFSFAIEQRQGDVIKDSLKIDSLIIKLMPHGKSYLLQKLRDVLYSGDYLDKPRYRTVFSDMVIPNDIDSIRVSFIVKSKKNEQTMDNRKEFSFIMVRYIGKVKKPGIRPID